MNKHTNGNLIICGASAVSADPNGTETTSIDLLISGIKRFASKVTHHA